MTITRTNPQPEQPSTTNLDDFTVFELRLIAEQSGDREISNLLRLINRKLKKTWRRTYTERGVRKQFQWAKLYDPVFSDDDLEVSQIGIEVNTHKKTAAPVINPATGEVTRFYFKYSASRTDSFNRDYIFTSVAWATDMAGRDLVAPRYVPPGDYTDEDKRILQSLERLLREKQLVPAMQSEYSRRPFGSH